MRKDKIKLIWINDRESVVSGALILVTKNTLFVREFLLSLAKSVEGKFPSKSFDILIIICES